MRCRVWNEEGGKGNVGVLIRVHEVYERMGVEGSRVVWGCDGYSSGRDGMCYGCICCKLFKEQ